MFNFKIANLNRARGSLCLCILLFLAGAGAALAQQTTSFTYQGRLTDGGTPANGTYEIQFTLWDATAGWHTAAAACAYHGDQECAGDKFRLSH